MEHQIAITSGVCIAAGAALGALGYGLFSPTSQLFAPVRYHGPAHRNQVALTFDDGPFPGSTEFILDHLKAAQIAATFFVIGRSALAHPDLLHRIHDEGHTIGNHTFDHHRWGLCRGLAYWHNQVRCADDAIAAVTGQVPTLFRPPMGFKCPPMAHAVRSKKIIAWSRSCRDGVATTPDHILARASSVQSGDILLLHDGRDAASRRDVTPTALALPRILSLLHKRNLSPVLLAELLRP